MKSFNVIWYNFNAKVFEPYDVMPYFVNRYNEVDTKPKTYSEFYNFIKKESMYMFHTRCQYEIVLSNWPGQDVSEKWDIHKQIMMNIDIITKILMDNGNSSEESSK